MHAPSKKDGADVTLRHLTSFNRRTGSDNQQYSETPKNNNPMNSFWINDVTELLATILLVSIPIVCAILYFRHRTLETNRRAEIMLRAMEKNNEGVSNEMLQGLNEPQKSL